MSSVNRETSIDTLPHVGFVRLPTILAVFPVAKSTWWAGVKSGRFPAPVKLGARVSAWNVQEIRDLISEHQSRPTQESKVSR